MERKSFSAYAVALGILALSFLAGTVAGCLFSAGSGPAADIAAAEYLSALDTSAHPPVGRVLIDTLLYPALCFLFGFAIPGVALIPLTVAFRGFLAAYTVACCARAFGVLNGFLFSAALIGAPLALSLPCLLLIGAHALLGSRALIGASSRGAPLRLTGVFRRFGASLCVLAAAAAVEIWLCPLLAGLAAARLSTA